MRGAQCGDEVSRGQAVVGGAESHPSGELTDLDEGVDEAQRIRVQNFLLVTEEVVAAARVVKEPGADRFANGIVIGQYAGADLVFPADLDRCAVSGGPALPRRQARRAG